MVSSEICILCLIGLPASGKSQLASLIAKHKLDFNEVLIFCYDELIRWDPNLSIWKEERKKICHDVENKIVQLLDKKNEKFLIILDDNMYYQSMRYTFYKLAKRHKIKFCQVFVDTPITICLQRNNKRTSPLPTNVILNINDKLEVPLQNNSWEKNTLVINGEDDAKKHLYKVKTLIESANSFVDLNVVNTERSQPQNKKHIADLALRRIISKLANEIKENGTSDLEEKILKLKRRRNEIMNLVKKDEILLPSHQQMEVYIKHFIPLFQSECIV